MYITTGKPILESFFKSVYAFVSQKNIGYIDNRERTKTVDYTVKYLLPVSYTHLDVYKRQV